MVRVGQFMEHYYRMLQQLISGQKLAGNWNMHFLDESRVVSVAPKPEQARMVLHCFQCRVLVLNPDFELLHLLEPLSAWHKQRNALQMIGQHFPGLPACF